MILQPEQEREEPSAVANFTPELEVEGGEGNTDPEALESTRNF